MAKNMQIFFKIIIGAKNQTKKMGQKNFRKKFLSLKIWFLKPNLGSKMAKKNAKIKKEIKLGQKISKNKKNIKNRQKILRNK